MSLSIHRGVIKREICFIDKTEYSHTIICLRLQAILEEYGQEEADATFEMFGLDKLGFIKTENEPLIQDDKEENKETTIIMGKDYLKYYAEKYNCIPNGVKPNGEEIGKPKKPSPIRIIRKKRKKKIES